MDKKKHIPLIGVGPAIVAPQISLTVLGITFSCTGILNFGKAEWFRIPAFVAGIILILFGVYLWIAANFQTKVDRYITENQLATTGVYAIVRNPIYSAFGLTCTGGILIANNLTLLIIPFLCWAYMTIFLKKTEEKWLLALHGQAYIDYCKRVNRCIPWFQKNQARKGVNRAK